ncbi:MAG: hypothetical protein ACP6IP_03775 [Candidatus Njordarchaeia archaeon]
MDILSISLYLILILLLALFYVLPRIMRRRYYMEKYKPVKIKASDIGEVSAKARIGMQWKPYPKNYSIAAALKMAHDFYHEENVSVHEINFYLGWTYTWVKIGPINRGVIFPARDPLEFIGDVGDFLGLKIVLRVTNNYELFIKALKYYIQEGIPVMAVIDVNALYGEEFKWDEEHLLGMRQYFIIINGYKEGNKFLYLDTIGENRDGEQPEREVDELTLANAIYSYLKTINFFNRFAFWTLERAPKKGDLEEVYYKLAELLIGKRYGGRSKVETGAVSLESLASEIEPLKDFNLESLEKIFKLAYELRRDNAKFLEEFIKKTGSEKIMDASRYLEIASNKYQKLTQTTDIGEAVELIRKAAEAERNAGEAFAEGLQ